MLACRIHAFPSFKTRVNRIDPLHAHFHNAAVTVCKRDGEGVWRCVCVGVCGWVCVCVCGCVCVCWGVGAGELHFCGFAVGGGFYLFLVLGARYAITYCLFFSFFFFLLLPSSFPFLILCSRPCGILRHCSDAACPSTPFPATRNVHCAPRHRQQRSTGTGVRSLVASHRPKKIPHFCIAE